MRFPIISLLLTTCLLAATANEAEDLETKQQVLHEHSLVKMEISAASKDQFATYMTSHCLTVTDMTVVDFLNNYILWEQVEFLDSVRNFLDPTNIDRTTIASYFHHLGHNFATNCSIKNDKIIRDSHHEISQEALFDNYMYDQMTRNEWTRLHL